MSLLAFGLVLDLGAGDYATRVDGPPGSLFGASLLAGDFNRDGEMDLAVSAPDANRVYVFFGPFPPGELAVPGDQDVTLVGEDGDMLWELASGGGDTLLVGAPGNGRVYEFCLAGAPGVLTPGDASWLVLGPYGSFFGASLAFSGGLLLAAAPRWGPGRVVCLSRAEDTLWVPGDELGVLDVPDSMDMLLDLGGGTYYWRVHALGMGYVGLWRADGPLNARPDAGEIRGFEVPFFGAQTLDTCPAAYGPTEDGLLARLSVRGDTLLCTAPGAGEGFLISLPLAGDLDLALGGAGLVSAPPAENLDAMEPFLGGIAVGLSRWSQGGLRPDAGRVLVYLNLRDTLDTGEDPPDLEVWGQEGDRLTLYWSLLTADTDADGVPELVIGAPGNGRVYIVEIPEAMLTSEAPSPSRTGARYDLLGRRNSRGRVRVGFGVKRVEVR